MTWMLGRLGALSVALVLALGISGIADAAPPAPQPEAYRDQPPLAYVSDGQVFVLDGDGHAPLRVRGATDACCVAWAPDGAYLAFQRHGDLWVAERDGTETRRVARAVRRWAWAPDGQALAVIPKPSPGGGAGTGIVFYGAEDPAVRDTQLRGYRVLDLAWAGLGRRIAVSAVPPGTATRADSR